MLASFKNSNLASVGILNLNFQIFPADKRVYPYCEVLKGKIFHSSDQMVRKKGHTRKLRSLILPFTKEMTFKSGPWVGHLNTKVQMPKGLVLKLRIDQRTSLT